MDFFFTLVVLFFFPPNNVGGRISSAPARSLRDDPRRSREARGNAVPSDRRGMSGPEPHGRASYLRLALLAARLAGASFARMALLVLASRVIDFFIVTLLEYFGLIAMDLFYVISSALSTYSIGVLLLRFTLFWLAWLTIAYGWLTFRPPPRSQQPPQFAPLALPTGSADPNSAEARLAKFFQ